MTNISYNILVYCYLEITILYTNNGRVFVAPVSYGSSVLARGAADVVPPARGNGRAQTGRRLDAGDAQPFSEQRFVLTPQWKRFPNFEKLAELNVQVCL